MNKKILIYILSILSVSLVFFVYWNSIKEDQAINGWEIYRNDTYGFEFKYPDDMTVMKYPSASDTSTIIFSVGYPDDKSYFAVYVSPNPDNLTLGQVIDRRLKELHGDIDSIEKKDRDFDKSDIKVSGTVVAGIRAKRIRIENWQDVGDTDTFLVRGKFIYTLNTESRFGLNEKGESFLESFRFTR